MSHAMEGVSTERRRSLLDRAAAIGSCIPAPPQLGSPRFFACCMTRKIDSSLYLRRVANEKPPLPQSPATPPPKLVSKESFQCPVKRYFRAIRSWDKVENLERTWDVYLSYETSCSDLFDRLKQAPGSSHARTNCPNACSRCVSRIEPGAE